MNLIDTFDASGHHSESLRVAVQQLGLAHRDRVQAEPGQGHQQLTRRPDYVLPGHHQSHRHHQQVQLALRRPG